MRKAGTRWEDADRRLSDALYGFGHRRPVVAAAARTLSLAGEHAALWLVAGLAAAAADRPRRGPWLRATALTAAAHLAASALKPLSRRPRPTPPAPAASPATSGSSAPIAGAAPTGSVPGFGVAPTGSVPVAGAAPAGGTAPPGGAPGLGAAPTDTAPASGAAPTDTAPASCVAPTGSVPGLGSAPTDTAPASGAGARRGRVADGGRRALRTRGAGRAGRRPGCPGAAGADGAVSRAARRPFRPVVGRYSFPSSHAASASAAAVAFAAVRSGARWTGAPVAAAMCLSRLLLGVHYPTDVVAGALLGAVTARVGGRWPAPTVQDRFSGAGAGAGAGGHRG
ncbi:phosphatase PAP2 family protein [Streptomyces lavendofoliae]|uniref:phosphatase PAP2 family protein n=1 Tax=Streptomyces lavendofoliae TaxID=67314 RepID=UPI003D8BD059